MKRGKDEGKIMGPMFPRLHVNDAEKGGPRAPPRNKMALYEQLSIPSQRFSHTVLPHSRNGITPNSAPYSSQGGGNERGVFSCGQHPRSLIPEKQYSQYSYLSAPLTQIEPRKKLDEDEFAVPIFMHSRPSQVKDREKATSFNPSYFNHSLNFSKAAKNCVIGHLPTQEAQFHKEGYSQESMVGHNQFVKAVSNSPIVEKTEKALKQTYPSLSHESGNSHSNRVILPELHAEAQPARGIHSSVSRDCMSVLTKSKCPVSSRAYWLENQNIVRDVANDGESREDGPSGSLQMGNLDRRESVSETLVVDVVSGLDMAPDNVVGILGQRHFWKARRTITNQQRVFAYQVFELHRLIKVQKGMALSTNLLEDVTSSGKLIEAAVPPKNIPLDNPDVAIPNVSECESVKPRHKNELLVQNSVGKHSISATHTVGKSQPPSVGSKHIPPGSGALNQTQPHGHQWLIPLMSPSEGLVYKPYPGNSFVFSVYGGYNVPPGSNPVTGSFSNPTYGIPLQRATFPPHGYFPPYCMPIMSTAISGSSVEQTSVPSMANQQSAQETNSSIPRDVKGDTHEDIDVQCSSSTVPSERLQGSGGMKSRDMLRLFPLSPTPTVDASPGSSPRHPLTEHTPVRVIKVVPHHSKTASESAARIFRSIQEERKRHESSM